MRRDPMARDVDAPRDPDLVVPPHVVEEARERSDAPGAADQAAMQSDRQHLRRIESLRVAFGVQHVERILEVCVELLAAVEALRGDEAHVVGVQRIGTISNGAVPRRVRTGTQ